MTHYVSDVYIITSLLLIITHYYSSHFCLLLHVITKLFITLFLLHCYDLLLHCSLLSIITLPIITYYYIIITSLLPHYYLIK